MVKVRLSRAGSKKRPFYHLVVMDSQKTRDGGFIERLGIYDPSRPISEARIDHDKLRFWVGRGAQTSERVGKVAREHAKWLAAQPDEPAAEAAAAPASGDAAAPAPAAEDASGTDEAQASA